MRIIKIFITCFILISDVAVNLTYAQPKIPKEEIPSDIPTEVKEQLKAFRSAKIMRLVIEQSCEWWQENKENFQR